MSGLSSKGATTTDDDDPGPPAESINDSEHQKRGETMPEASTIATATATTTTTTSVDTEEAATLSASAPTEIAAAAASTTDKAVASATTEAAASAVDSRAEPPVPATPVERKKTADEIKAEARAYALSSATKKKVPLWRQQQKMYQKQMQKAAVQNAAALAYHHHHHTLVVGREQAARQQQQPQPQPLSGTAEATTVAKAEEDSMAKQQLQRHPQQPQQQQQPHYHSNYMQIYHRAHPYMLQPPPPAPAAGGEAVSHSTVLAQLALQTKQPGHSNAGNSSNTTTRNNAAAVHTTTTTTTMDELLNDKNLDDYTRFVKALSVEDSWEMFLGDDEEEDYQLDPKEDDDDEDDDGDGDDDDDDDEENENGDNDEEKQDASGSKGKIVSDATAEATPATTSTTTTAPMSTTPIKVVTETDGENANQQDDDDKAATAASPASKSTSSSGSGKSSPSSPSFNFPDWDAAVYEELEQELGWLEEEDMEAAVATLLDNHPRKKTDDEQMDNNNINSPLPSTLPLPFPAMITNHYFEAPPSGPEHTQISANATGYAPGHSTQPGITTAPAGTPGTATTSVKPFSTSFSPSEILPQRSKRPPVRGGLGRGAAAAASSRSMPSTTVTQAQHAQLKDLMHKHYQLLMQQAVLSVRAAHYHKYNRSRMDRLDRTDFISGGETADDMAEILDAACGMLQDLDQNRKDSIRHFMQFHHHHQSTSNSTNHKKRQHHHLSTKAMSYAAPQGRAPRSLFADDDVSDDDDMVAWGESRQAERRLTRAQFNKSLQEQNQGRQSESVFDIQGLCNLGDTFATLDKSVIQSDASEAALPPATDRRPNQMDGKSTDDVAKDKEDARKNREEHLLEIDSTEKACLMVLKKANVKYDERLVPGARDVSDNFVDPREFFGPTFKPPCSKEEELVFRRNRNLFTAAEDNLVLRGVNLFGEKQWLLIADRFMPDRSINIISQRYSKLCLMLYKANGIKIDESGNLGIPPRFENFEDIPRASLRTLRPVNPPTVFNVHRWSLEEDLTLLKAVPKMGHMWAELGARLIPHRDRGHLRKRYQVLERRIKAATTRSKKFTELKGVKAPASKGPVSRSAAPRENTVTVAAQESRRTKLAPTTPAHVRPPPIHAHSPPTTFAHLSSPVHAYARSPPHAYPPPPHAHALSPKAYPLAPYPYHPHYMYAAPHYPHLYSPGYPPPPYSPSHHMPYPYAYPPPGYLPPAQPSPPAPAPSVRPPVPPATLRESAPKATVEFKDPESGSRVAFERLSQESQWSQMSDMLADDTLLVASAMATDLARGPAKGAVNARTAAAPVTASVKATGGEKGTASNDVTDSTSFLAGVLERVGGGRGGETPSKRTRLSSSNDTSKQDGVFPETPTGLSPPPLQASPPSTSVSISSLAQGSSHRIFAGTPGKSLFGENATLMENDLEAISALNLLGHSPATLNGSERRASDAGIVPAPRKSLFAQVVEGSTTMASPAPAPLPVPPRQSKKRNLQF